MKKPTIEHLKKEHKELTVAIKGYIDDSKKFGFEPDELQQMKNKLREVQKKIKKNYAKN